MAINPNSVQQAAMPILLSISSLTENAALLLRQNDCSAPSGGQVVDDTVDSDDIEVIPILKKSVVCIDISDEERDLSTLTRPVQTTGAKGTATLNNTVRGVHGPLLPGSHKVPVEVHASANGKNWSVGTGNQSTDLRCLPVTAVAQTGGYRILPVPANHSARVRAQTVALGNQTSRPRAQPVTIRNQLGGLTAHPVTSNQSARLQIPVGTVGSQFAYSGTGSVAVPHNTASLGQHSVTIGNQTFALERQSVAGYQPTGLVSHSGSNAVSSLDRMSNKPSDRNRGRNDNTTSSSIANVSITPGGVTVYRPSGINVFRTGNSGSRTAGGLTNVGITPDGVMMYRPTQITSSASGDNNTRQTQNNANRGGHSSTVVNRASNEASLSHRSYRCVSCQLTFNTRLRYMRHRQRHAQKGEAWSPLNTATPVSNGAVQQPSSTEMRQPVATMSRPQPKQRPVTALSRLQAMQPGVATTIQPPSTQRSVTTMNRLQATQPQLATASQSRKMERSVATTNRLQATQPAASAANHRSATQTTVEATAKPVGCCQINKLLQETSDGRPCNIQS
ncbi:PREDICTED: uncharacterized protein LOC106808259 isoform X2 [Priapulus caudatus]|uniref:Uncharacterized protein LOC106808259 isoform X2 n=1 Tax=Priapulus caudatus TaxID=37621 RepID=A0ABM1E2J1_PRICU|nr:PREDICTED: uncharacterized protein LOC106808259 isoform X2 [Priapulus caudatus]